MRFFLSSSSGAAAAAPSFLYLLKREWTWRCENDAGEVILISQVNLANRLLECAFCHSIYMNWVMLLFPTAISLKLQLWGVLSLFWLPFNSSSVQHFIENYAKSDGILCLHHWNNKIIKQIICFYFLRTYLKNRVLPWLACLPERFYVFKFWAVFQFELEQKLFQVALIKTPGMKIVFFNN